MLVQLNDTADDVAVYGSRRKPGAKSWEDAVLLADTPGFPDCNTMKFTYNGHTDAQTNGPGGSGTRTWTRLANINSLVCD